ncbi:helix-turn-helix domain-containing protein [Dolosigranulum pigrum]|uniref:helix-turn-helix domain-containing protein n=1 Tax=Dolosigranulum pigrum TaxID=29394 RepID=UPI0035A24DEA
MVNTKRKEASYENSETFKLLRHRKKLTQKEASESIISHNRLSTFEQGKGDVSYKNFIRLLDQMNISVLESAVVKVD